MPHEHTQFVGLPTAIHSLTVAIKQLCLIRNEADWQDVESLARKMGLQSETQWQSVNILTFQCAALN
jgi:hypothetical protein